MTEHSGAMNGNGKAGDGGQMFNLAHSMAEAWAPMTSKLAEAQATWANEAASMMAPKGTVAPALELGPMKEVWDYWVDAGQRQILFWDVMRKRGNQAIGHYEKGKPPVLVFDYELIMDGRDLERPVNYMLLRILPERGVKIDPEARPFVIVDPRAGHGPGIGGMKESSQVGVAMRAGHPVYFVAFRPDPEPNQTIEDIAIAEAQFLERVCERHANAEGKPVVIGNCQAGWAIMMMASVAPEHVGALSISGSPLSYWAGIEGQNPMRYLGGLLGGSWLASLYGDLGNGKFDGAYLVQNFENLNPANTYWTKQYNLYSKVDTEEERYLGFEKWWSGYFTTTKQEMRGIVDELFVGNKLTKGTIQTSDRRRVDLQNIAAPIVVIASWGDNITPPPQALYWIADLYENVDELIANEQVIVYSLDDRIGHLGIFVSAKVAEKQHAELVNCIDIIDSLPPGLYEMVLEEKAPEDVGADLLPGNYLVRFEHRTIDDILSLGDGREHEQAFETVAEISEINEGLYDTFVSPWVKMWTNDWTAEALRWSQPGRVERTLISDQNPALWPLKSMAEAVRRDRRATNGDNALTITEKAVSDQIVQSLNLYRDMRDHMTELTFKAIYNNPLVEALTGLRAPYADERKPRARDDELEERLHDKIEAIRTRQNRGGFAEAVVRILLACAEAEQMVDARGYRLAEQIGDKHPAFRNITPKQLKELVKEEAFMLRFDPELAKETLPKLLPTQEKRREAIALVRQIGQARGEFTQEREAVLEEVEKILGLDGAAPSEPATKPKATPKAAPKRARGNSTPAA